MGKSPRKDLTDQQKQAIQLLVMDRWSKSDLNKHIADTVGVTPQTVRKWRENELFRDEFQRQMKLYRANFDDVKMADRKERVLALERLFDACADHRTELKLKILAAIRQEVGDDKVVVDVNHNVAPGVQLPPRAESYEEWVAQNRQMALPAAGAVEAESVVVEEETPTRRRPRQGPEMTTEDGIDVFPPKTGTDKKNRAEIPNAFRERKAAIARLNDQQPVGDPS